ncbi:MAG: inorganic phosphate transporter [Gemmatimonadaceae bacterium]|nr:inorganic phosphate transporter [Gemmatimonadaceae bacterium]
MIAYVIGIVVVALIFDFINGFHDSANSIATIVGTRVLTPFKAVLWAATFNFAALFTVGTAVAKAISSGYVDQSAISANVIAAALLGAIIWNLITWWFGIPSSSSHALIGGFAGAAVASKGFEALNWGHKWVETLSAIALSPALGAMLGMGLMVLVFRVFQRASPGKVDQLFKPAQLLSSALLSLAHGGNDAQKTMGIIVGLLAAPSVRKLFEPHTTGWLSHMYVPNTNTIPIWVEIAAYFAISLGTLFGGWRIVHTMGTRITKLRPVGGFCAETGGAIVILAASKFGIPVSTTHTITGAIVGVGAANRVRAVRWGLAGNIVWAWIVTIPAAGLIAALSALILNAIVVVGRPA